MSAEENKAIVRGFLADCLSKCDITAFDRYHTITQMKEFFPTVWAAFPDNHITVDQQLADGDWVVTRVTTQATHRGDWLGVPATGKEVTFQGISMDRIADGKIVEHFSQGDLFGVTMLEQLGAWSPPE